MKKVGLVSLALASCLYSDLSANVLGSISEAQNLITSVQKSITQTNANIISSQTSIDTYTKMLSTTKNSQQKASINSLITNFKTNLAFYQKQLATQTVALDKAKQDLLDTTAYFNKPTVTMSPTVVTVKPAIPSTTSVEGKWLAKYDLVGVRSAWEQGYTGKGVTIADIDTGISPLNNDINRFFTSTNVIDFSTKYDNGVATRYVTTVGNVDAVAVSSTAGSKIYSKAPTITIVGNGTGAKGEAVLVNGKISSIKITDFGTGYTGTPTVLVNGVADNSYTFQVKLAGVDYDGHGTQVAALMVGAFNGSGIVGTAFDANLIAVKVGDTALSNQDIVDGAALAVTRGATIINQSLESKSAISTAQIATYKQMLQAGTVIVNAAGNQGSTCTTMGTCNTFATIPLSIGSAEMAKLPGTFVVVGASNSSGTDLATFSNRAGITKDYYIVAPGQYVNTTSLKDNGVAASGTSFAAPIVSGVLADLKQKWPRLSGAQQVRILFDTATDMGAPGVDAVYGNGLLNATKAFSPVGDLVVPSALKNVAGLDKVVAMSSYKTSVNGSAILTSKISSLTYLNNTVAFDSYQRDYQVNLTSTVATSLPTFSFDQFMTAPVGKGVSVGINQTYNAAMVAYSKGENSLSYSKVDGVLGTSGTGVLGYSGTTHYVGLKHNTVKEGTGFSIEGTYGYVQHKDVSDSSLRMSNVQSIGLKAKAVYNGFGVMVNVPGKIISGNMTTELSVGSDVDGNIAYEKVSTDLSKGAFEKQAGLTYSMGGLNITAYKAYDVYNVAGMNSNNVSVNYSKFW